MHRTTIELDDKLIKNLKEICIREKRTFKGLVKELVSAGLEGRQKVHKKATTGLRRWHTTKTALPKGIDPSDRSTYAHYLQRSLP